MAKTDFELTAVQELSDEVWSAIYQLDGINEVLEWNNEGVSADEIACMWLAQLRMIRTLHGLTPDSAPFAPNRPLDNTLPQTHTTEIDPGVLAALAEPEMQQWEKNINGEVDDDAALVRALVLGFLPVDDPATIALLTARSTALTHAHPSVVWSCIALAVTVRQILAIKTNNSPLADQEIIRCAVERTVDWLESSAPSQIPGDSSTVASLLRNILEKEVASEKTSSPALSTLHSSLESALSNRNINLFQDSSAPSHRPQLIAAALAGAARPELKDVNKVEENQQEHALRERAPGLMLVLDNFYAQLGIDVAS